MDVSKEQLGAWLARVHRLQEERAELLTTDELHAVAGELGIDEETLEAIREEAARHATRAHTLAGVGRLPEAVDELRAALELMPTQATWQVALARLLLDLGASNPRENWLEEATGLARAALREDPGNRTAAELLVRIDAVQAQRNQHKSARRTTLVAAGAAFSLMTMGVATVFLLGSPVDPTVAPASSSSAPLATTETPWANPGTPAHHGNKLQPARGSDPTGTGSGGPEAITVDVVDETGLFGSSIRHDVTQSDYNHFGNDSKFYTAQFRFTNVGQQEIAAFRAELRIHGTGDTLLHVVDLVSTDSNDPAWRPRDTRASGITVQLNAAATHARLHVRAGRLVEGARIADGGSGDRTVMTPGSIQLPSGVRVRVAERYAEYRPNSFSSSGGWHHVHLSYENEGTQPLQLLRAEVEWRDAQGSVVRTVPNYPVTQSESPLLPGERRVFTYLAEVPASALQYRVRFTQAQ